MGMIEETHPGYDLYQLFLSNADTGHAGTARDRTYVIASLQERTSCQQDPFELHSIISKKIMKVVQTQPHDYCLADPWEIALEAMQAINRRRGEWTPECLAQQPDLRGLLSPRESEALFQYEEAYMKRFPRPPATDKNLVVFLGDDPRWTLNWSAVSKRVPTMRLNARTGKLWFPKLNRWLVARERLAMLGWPVTDSMADAMSVPVIPARDSLRAGDLAGNAMHLPSVALAQLLALSCFAPIAA